MNNKRPTQKDIARLAGVSQTTVSQVLNNSTAVAIPEDTRRRVLEIIEQIGYVPDRSARSLRTSKTYTIAAIIPDIANPFYPTFVRGIQTVSEHLGFDLVIYNTDGEAEKEMKCLRSLRQNRADGVIATLFHLTSADLAELGVPAVHLYQPEVSQPIDTVFINNVAAAKSIVTYLIERGHGCIGMIAGEDDTPPRRNRIRGYVEALTEHHIPLQEILIRGGSYNETGGYNGLKDLLGMIPLPFAVFAANDLIAMGALQAAREAGLRVPQDIAIAGFDDIPAARLVNPPLTTVTQFQDQIGIRAAEMLFERIDGLQAPPRAVEMPFQRILRESA